MNRPQQPLKIRPTITMVVHRPILPSGSNGWGSALYQGYIQFLVEGGADSMRIISAPPAVEVVQSPSVSGAITYHSVPVEENIFEVAKAGAIDVYAWDLLHLIRANGSPTLVCDAFVNNREQYDATWKNYFLYSIYTANYALTLARNDAFPVFHLHDVHDAFVSALFEGNYNRKWLQEIIGKKNFAILDDFENTRKDFLEQHSSIFHMRFWHTPSVEPDSWHEWFAVDPYMASHFLSGIMSSPFVVHAPMWKQEFSILINKALGQMSQYLDTGKDQIFHGIGVGPIGFDRTAFTERFDAYDSSGEYKNVPTLLKKWASSIREAVGDDDPIIVFLTCRGDDPKNNLPETIKALSLRARADDDFCRRVAVICVYTTSREGEHRIYRDTLAALDKNLSELKSIIGSERTIEVTGGDDDLTAQTAGFLLANMFVCTARGGFDIVGVEASIVGAIRANKDIAIEYQEILAKYHISNSFHLVMAHTVGCAPYLESVVDSFTTIETRNGHMPKADAISVGVEQAWSSISTGNSHIKDGQVILDGIDEICSAPACIAQWMDAAFSRNPGAHPRTIECEQIVSRANAQRILTNSDSGKAMNASTFESSSFEKDALLIVDFDGTIAEFVGDPASARPNKKIITCLRDFLEKSPARQFRVVSARSTKFFSTISEFVKLVEDFPNQVEFFGFYGVQIWNTNMSHEIPPALHPYVSAFAQAYESYDPSSLVESIDKVLREARLFAEVQRFERLNIKEIVFENRDFAMTIHSRRLLDELGLLEVNNKQYAGDELTDSEAAKANCANMIKTEIEKCAHEIVEIMNSNGTDVKIKMGSMICEIIPTIVTFSKADAFVKIRETTKVNGRSRPTYFAGDDKGDAEIFSITTQSSDVVTIFINSSAADNSQELMEMRAIATIDIGPSDQKSAVENFAEVLESKVHS